MSKKEIVIETARKLFTKYGYKKVSMDEIAKVSNVTKKTIYSYFKDKEELFKYFISEELEAMRKEMTNKDLSFLEIISSGIYYVLTLRKNSLFFNNILNSKENVQSSNFLKLYDDEIINFLEEIITKEIKKNTIRSCDAHLTAFIIYKVYISVMFEYEKELDEAKVKSEVVSILKNGLLN